ncbi:MAG: NifU family protein [Peptoniphilus sp.]|nr:NifU family protein [Peptoniphilus sp.]
MPFKEELKKTYEIFEESLVSVKKYMQSHGGDISIVDISPKKIEVKISGACAFCQGGKEEIRELIMSNLSDEIKNNYEIEVVSYISSDLLDQAKEILSR